VLGDVEMKDAPPMVDKDDQDEEDAQASSRNGEEVDRDQARTWLVRNVRQVCDGGERRLGINREAVRSAPRRRAPEFAMDSGGPRGFASVIFVTRAVISALTGGRPSWAPRILVSARRLDAAATATRCLEQRARASLHRSAGQPGPEAICSGAAGRLAVLLLRSCWRRANSRARCRWPAEQEEAKPVKQRADRETGLSRI
jgi:hypothetical protein